MTAVPDLFVEALQLPEDERASLALELLRSLDNEVDDDAAEAWDAEISRRLAEVEAGVADSVSYEEYREHVRKRREARGA